MISIILAADGIPQEVALVAAAAGAGMTVMRRPVDAAELLAAAACDRAMPVVLAASLPRMSRDVCQRVLADGRPVVGLSVDAKSEERLRDLGVVTIVDAGQAADDVAARISGILGSTAPSVPAVAAEHNPGRGRLIAVWGPSGAPGRSVTAVGLSESLVSLGRRTCTIDADLQAPALGLHLGIREDVSGLVVACRQADHGSLDVRALHSAARAISPTWSVLLGIGRPEQQSHVHPSSVTAVLARSVEAFDVTVVDLSATIPQEDDDLLGAGYDASVGPVLAAADDLVVVTRADPLGVARLLSVWPNVRAASPLARPRIVLTHAERAGARAMRGTFERAGIGDPVHIIRRDTSAFGRCLARGATLGEVARRSRARQAYGALARAIIEVPFDPDHGRSAQ